MIDFLRQLANEIGCSMHDLDSALKEFPGG